MTGRTCTLYEVRDEAAWITLNRPDARNALSPDLIRELYDHLAAAGADDGVRAIVITGAGQAFCAGADLKRPRGGAPSTDRAVTFDAVLSAIWNGRKPVIAAVNGHAFGGGLGLIGAADIVVATSAAKFSFSEVRIGVIPAIISVVCLRKIGVHHGMRLFLTGDRFDGAQAVGYGLVHRAVPPEDLGAAVEEEIDKLRLGGPAALAECKRLVREVPDLPLEEGFEKTRAWSKRMFDSDEAAEGMAAFREKRRPSWANKA